MLMTALRNKIKIIIVITLVAFLGLIVFEWGMQASSSRGGRGGNPGVLGRVNGHEITDLMYRRAYQTMLQGFEARAGRSAEGADFDAISDDAWASLVQELVLYDEIEKYGIEITDAEILELLQTSPPDFVRGNFTNEQGQFDELQYRQALAQSANDPNLTNFFAQVEAILRSSAPADKVRNFVGLGARVTGNEVRQRFLDRNEQVEVKYVESATVSADLDEESLDESEVRAWYDAHTADYAVGRQAVLDLVRMSKGASADDSSLIREDLENLREEILAGADFAEKARQFSEDTSADRGGDLGWFGRGDMVPAFDEAVFAMQPGDVSEVIETPFGYHLIQVEDRRTEDGAEQVQARHILMRIEASNRTIRAAASRIDDFLFALEDGKSFEAAAEEVGLEVERTPAFERDAFVPGFGALRAGQRFAFSAEPGATTDRPMEDDEYVYAFRLVEVKEPRTQSFDEVADQARFALAQERRKEMARAALEAAVTASDGTLESIADQLDAAVQAPAPFSRDSFVPGVGRRNGFVAAAFGLAEGERSGMVESDRGYYVLEMVKRIPADETLFADQRDQLRGQLLLEKRQTLITAWMEQLLRNAVVEDFRGGGKAHWSPRDSDFLYAPA